MPRNDELRAWLFRALTFETEAEQFRSAGIRIGVGADLEAAANWDALLGSFGLKVRSEALRMAGLYALLYCFENAIRDLVVERLQEVHGEDWWKQRVSAAIQKATQSVYDNATTNAWLDGAKGRLIDFATFGQLVKIIVENWEDFKYIIPTQAWLNQKMNEIEDVRNFIAHSRLLSSREFDRMALYIEDWNRQVGL